MSAAEVPLWVGRAEFLRLLTREDSPESAGLRFFDTCEPWVGAAFELATGPAVRLAELSDWTALVDRHSVVDLGKTRAGDTELSWSAAPASDPDASECAFRLGVLRALLRDAARQPATVRHTTCRATGADVCSFEVEGVVAEPDTLHARMLFEATLLARAHESREEMRRRLLGFSPRSGPLPDVRQLRAVRRFMEEVEDIILVFDRSFLVLDANRAAVEFSGMTLEEIRGLSARQLLSADSFEATLRSVPMLLETGAFRALQVEARTRDGWVPLEVSARMSEDGDTIVAIARDISRHLYLERELGARNQLLAAQNERIRQADLLKSEFLANVSHELTTPLTCIQGFARMLRKDLDEEIAGGAPRLTLDKRLEFLRILQNEAQRMGDLITGLLELSKLESGGVTLDRARVSLNRIVQESLLVLKPRLEDRGVEVEARLGPELPEAMLDPDRMKQVLLNLLDNAIKFSESGSKVSVRTSALPGTLELAVCNDAPGLDPRQLDRIFDRFVQADGSFKRQHGGVGLGLNLVRAIVELHDGQVWADMPEPGRVELVARLPILPDGPAAEPLSKAPDPGTDKTELEG